ncbi:MAG: hypothetical protein HDR22_01465 [Lachnospiraceae bacterium]|nr:hypothetical protein [Lachnospiraceae bacterium]
MKKIITIAVGFAMIVGALTGCGTKSSLSEAGTNSEKAGSSQMVPPSWKRSLVL